MKRVEVQWNELVEGNTYYVECVGKEWDGLLGFNGYYIFKNNLLKGNGLFGEVRLKGYEIKIYKEVEEEPKKFNELFKIVTWDELVEGKRYWVIAVGSEWFEPRNFDCECVYENSRLYDGKSYFDRGSIENAVEDYSILILEYLEEGK